MSFLTNHTPLYDSIMEAFINDGALTRAIQQYDKTLRERIRFVSYTPVGGSLRILILGNCGMCSARHIRNICNSTYTADILFPILTRVFPVITRIDVVRTDDADFGQLVEGLGG